MQEENQPRHSHHHTMKNPAHKPDWWPEDEPWPPQAPLRGHFRNRRFLRRAGCFFLLGMVIFAGLLVLLGTFLARSFFMEDLHHRPSTFLPLVLLLLFLVASIFFFRRGWRRLSRPMEAYMNASERIAQGDYTARVETGGPLELRRVAESFNQMAERLETQNEERRNLLADITHELRTPLTVVQGTLEGILDGVYPADEIRLRSMMEETGLMARLIEDLRTLALAESKALSLHREWVEMDAFLNEVTALFADEASARQVSLSVSASEETGQLWIDPERMRQVFQNLLRNALRYTPAGGNIRLQAEPQKKERLDGLCLTLRDNGNGIPPHDLEHIFDRYYKSADSNGMGLGLAIARRLVEAHDGTIRADSAVGEGTTIQIWLPRQNP